MTVSRRRRTLAALIVVATVMPGVAMCDEPQQNESDDFDGFPRYDENSPEARFEAICEAWRFPESDGNLGGGGAGTSADEDGLIPAIWKFTWRSTEPYADVWNFYAGTCGHDEQFDENSYGVWTGRHDGGFYVVDDRLWLPNADLLYSTFVYSAPEYVATVMLRPPMDERGTYINLSIASRADAVEFGDSTGELHAAAAAGNVSRVRPVIDAGASVNDKDAEGRTPVMIAAANGHAALCQTLMLLGASATARDALGWTALMHAAENGHAGVIDALFQMQQVAASRVRELNVEWSILKEVDVESRGSFRFPIATNAQDNAGETAQRKAAANGDMNCLRALHHGGIGSRQSSGGRGAGAVGRTGGGTDDIRGRLDETDRLILDWWRSKGLPVASDDSSRETDEEN